MVWLVERWTRDRRVRYLPGSHGCGLEHDTLSSGADSWKTISFVDKNDRFGMLVPYLVSE